MIGRCSFTQSAPTSSGNRWLPVVIQLQTSGCYLSGWCLRFDQIQLSAKLARVDVASFYLVIGSPLVVEIAQDRSGAPATLRRRHLAT
jgi:hypothetical protein